MSDLDFLKDFNATEIASAANTGDYEPLPPGKYYGRVTQAEVQTTKKGDGKMVFVRLDIEGPSGAGRVVFDRMLVAHPNPTAVEIGQGRFGALCIAAGFTAKPADTQEFLGKVVAFKLKVEKSQQYGDRNAVVTFAKHDGAQGPTTPFNDDDIPF